MNSTIEHILHVIAGLIIVAAPMLLAGIPVSWQAETVGGLIALALSVFKSFYNSTV